MFFAHTVAAWLGIPTGAAIVIMLTLRNRLKKLRTRRNQADGFRIDERAGNDPGERTNRCTRQAGASGSGP